MSAVAHDFKGRAVRSVRAAEVSAPVAPSSAKAPAPISLAEHNSRAMRTEFNGGLVLGFVFGACTTFVLFALCLWWAPLGWVAS